MKVLFALTVTTLHVKKGCSRGRLLFTALQCDSADSRSISEVMQPRISVVVHHVKKDTQALPQSRCYTASHHGNHEPKYPSGRDNHRSLYHPSRCTSSSNNPPAILRSSTNPSTLQVQTRTVLFFHLFSDILVVRLVNHLDTPTNGGLSLASEGDRNHPMVLLLIERWIYKLVSRANVTCIRGKG